MEIYENNFGVGDANVAKTLTNLVCLGLVFNLLYFNLYFCIVKSFVFSTA